MSTELDPKAAVEALQRRRVQNRLAQRNRRKRQAELEQKQTQEFAKQKEHAGKEQNGDIVALGQTAMNNGQSNRAVESNMSVDTTDQMNSSPTEQPVAIGPEKLIWNSDGHAARSLPEYDRVDESITAFLLNSEFDMTRDSDTPRLSPIHISSVGNSQVEIDSTLHHEKIIRATGSSFGSRRRDSQTQMTKCDMIQHQLVEKTLSTGRLSAPTNSSAMKEACDRGRLLHNYEFQNQGKTALHISVERGDVGIVQLLLLHGVEVNRTDEWGRTALHYAVQAAHAEIVSQLLAAGADIEARDCHGRSPLHVAANAGSEGIIRLLAEEGADLNAPIDILRGRCD